MSLDKAYRALHSAKTFRTDILGMAVTGDFCHQKEFVSREMPGIVARNVKGVVYVRRAQNGYGAFSVNSSNVPDVRHYIQNQKEHHRTMTFQDEFRLLLTRHGVEFDERYVWD